MKILITGSTTGLGLLAGEKLVKQGHEVIFHARNSQSQLKPDTKYVFGDLSRLDEVKSLAEQANGLGPFDVVIHNAGVYTASSKDLFAIETDFVFLHERYIDFAKNIFNLRFLDKR